jgi:TonB family protein
MLVPPVRVSVKAPNLLVSWSSPRQVFLDNLLDRLLFRRPLQPWLTSRPAPFWPDVFVDQRLPWRRLAGSGVYHVLAVALVYVITANWVTRPQVKPRSPFDGTELTYYSVSEYLPEINTGSPPTPKERKGQPAFAKQRIISLPPAPDNVRQTIVTPDPTKIAQDVPLPNMVVNTTIPAPPEAAMVHEARLTAPQITPISPPPDVSEATSRIAALPAPDVVGPAADPTGMRSKLNLPNVAGPEIIGPPPSPDAAQSKARLNIPAPSVVGPAVGGDVRRSVGSINMAHSDIGVAEPKLPVAEQRAVMTIRSGVGSGGRGRPAGGGGGAQAQAPSLASVTGAPAGSKNAGQLIALGIQPVAVNGPIVVPRGSRAGEFAAGPEGQPDAPGTPDIHGGGSGNGGSGNGSIGAGNGDTAGPLGISVSPGPAEVPAGPVVAASPVPPGARPQPKAFPLVRSTRVADIARETRPTEPTESPTKPDEVFGTKKYYSMTLNMPSVTSAGGSCIIRFAELHQEHLGGDLTAPIAMLKVDPAYPPEAIRDRVEGTVTLYAVIHKDGSVGEVRVLHGVDERLDRNALVALTRWQFRPATRNGSAVDLEAVVQIPFIAKRATF